MPRLVGNFVDSIKDNPLQAGIIGIVILTMAAGYIGWPIIIITAVFLGWLWLYANWDDEKE